MFPRQLLRHHCSRRTNSDPEPLSGYGTATSFVNVSGDSSNNFSVGSDPELQIALNMDLAEREKHGPPVAMPAENHPQEALFPVNNFVGKNKTRQQPSVEILDRNKEAKNLQQSSQEVSRDISGSQGLSRDPARYQDPSVPDHFRNQELVKLSNIGSRSRELGARPKYMCLGSSALSPKTDGNIPRQLNVLNGPNTELEFLSGDDQAEQVHMSPSGPRDQDKGCLNPRRQDKEYPHLDLRDQDKRPSVSAPVHHSMAFLSATESGNTLLSGRGVSLPVQSLPVPVRSPVLPREQNLEDLTRELEDR